MYQEQIQKHAVSQSYFFIGSLLNKHQTLWKIFSKILKIMFFRIRLSSETGFYNIQVGTQTYYCTQTHIQYSSYIIPKKRILPLEIDLQKKRQIHKNSVRTQEKPLFLQITQRRLFMQFGGIQEKYCICTIICDIKNLALFKPLLADFV